MIEVGRLCVKLAGRDAGKKCVVVGILKDNMVLVDGETRRRKCNIRHLEPLKETVKIDKGADHEKVAAALKSLKIEARVTKPKQAGEKPKHVRKKKELPPEMLEKKVEKKEKPKKEAKKKEEKAKPAAKEEKKTEAKPVEKKPEPAKEEPKEKK